MAWRILKVPTISPQEKHRHGDAAHLKDFRLAAAGSSVDTLGTAGAMGATGTLGATGSTWNSRGSNGEELIYNL